MKKWTVIFAILSVSLVGGVAAVASSLPPPEPEVDLAVANAHVDAQLHRVLFRLLEQEKRQHPFSP